MTDEFDRLKEQKNAIERKHGETLEQIKRERDLLARALLQIGPSYYALAIALRIVETNQEGDK